MGSVGWYRDALGQGEELVTTTGNGIPPELDTTETLGIIELPPPGDAGLGAVAAIASVVDAGLKLKGFLDSVKGLFGGGREEIRRQENAAAFSRALAGDEGALLFLKQRSGDFGVATVPGVSEPIGGWATDSAQRDARQKYDAVLQAIANQEVPPPGTVTPIPQLGGGQIGGIPVALLVLGGAGVLLAMRRKS